MQNNIIPIGRYEYSLTSRISVFNGVPGIVFIRPEADNAILEQRGCNFYFYVFINVPSVSTVNVTAIQSVSHVFLNQLIAREPQQ